MDELKKLKKHFLLIGMMLSVMAVITVFTVVCVFSYRSEIKVIDAAMEQAIRREQRIRDGSKYRRESGDFLPDVYVAAVRVDREGGILSKPGYGSGMEEQDLITAVQYVCRSDAPKGTVPEYNLLYLRTDTSDGERIIAFADRGHLETVMEKTVLFTALGCLLGLVLLFFITDYLSSLSIRPVEENWRRQKQFVADVSHDLKTPLTVILTNTGILASHGENTVDAERRWIDSTGEEAERMRKMVDSMMELSASENAAGRLPLTAVDMTELTQRTALWFEPVMFESRLTLETDIAPGQSVSAQEDALSRILHILLDNARKYAAPDTSVTVTLSPWRQQVRLTVRSIGETIPSEILPHIFERFYRADPSRGSGGNGLGLSIARNLTEAMGGHISVCSSEKEGTVFAVTLHRAS